MSTLLMSMTVAVSEVANTVVCPKLIFNIDMDCDGLKKNLVILTDGGLYNAPTSLISQANDFWGNRIPCAQ